MGRGDRIRGQKSIESSSKCRTQSEYSESVEFFGKYRLSKKLHHFEDFQFSQISEKNLESMFHY